MVFGNERLPGVQTFRYHPDRFAGIQTIPGHQQRDEAVERQSPIGITAKFSQMGKRSRVFSQYSTIKNPEV